MRHKKDLGKLGRPAAHRKAVVQSLVRSLFTYDRIQTTLTKAKAAQRLAERLVSRSQRDEVAARRYVYSHLNDHSLVKHVFDEVRPRFEDRKSGFTRIFLLGNRPGDGAQMAMLEMVVKGERVKEKSGSKSSGTAKSTAGKTHETKPRKTRAAGTDKSKQEKKFAKPVTRAKKAKAPTRTSSAKAQKPAKKTTSKKSKSD